MTSLLAVMLFLLIQEKSRGNIDIGDFALVFPLVWRLNDRIWDIGQQFIRFSYELGDCIQGLTIVSAPHDIVDNIDAKPLRVVQGAITFDNVSFRYLRNKNLFEKACVNIERGTKIGLVGFSGSGKTTFVNLILRLFDIQSGRILIDGQDIAQMT